jgi:hypothetical protein
MRTILATSIDPSIEDVIQTQKPVRTFSQKAIPGKKKERIQKTLEQTSGPFGAPVRFKWLVIPELKSDEKISFGT